MPSPVSLSVYDLMDSLTPYNKVLKKVGTGVYHAGVVVYGHEWSYGGFADPEDEGTGVYENPEGPRCHEVHVYKQSVPMGETSMTEMEVFRLIDKLEDEWNGQDYHLLTHNCCDFSNEFCKRLGLEPMPGWVKSAAGLGAGVTDLVNLVPRTVSQGKLQRGASQDTDYKIGDFTLGAAASVGSVIERTVNAGKAARGASTGDAYRFGDFSRGFARTVAQGFAATRAEGQAARDAPAGSGFWLSDIPRGVVAGLARK